MPSFASSLNMIEDPSIRPLLIAKRQKITDETWLRWLLSGLLVFLYTRHRECGSEPGYRGYSRRETAQAGVKNTLRRLPEVFDDERAYAGISALGVRPYPQRKMTNSTNSLRAPNNRRLDCNRLFVFGDDVVEEFHPHHHLVTLEG